MDYGKGDQSLKIKITRTTTIEMVNDEDPRPKDARLRIATINQQRHNLFKPENHELA